MQSQGCDTVRYASGRIRSSRVAGYEKELLPNSGQERDTEGRLAAGPICGTMNEHGNQA